MPEAFIPLPQAQYDKFNELRQSYYVAGRCLLINNIFGTSGINFGYAVELSLKQLLISKGYPAKKLYNHSIAAYYREAVDNRYIPPLNVSDDFIQFMDERLNARYPSHLNKLLESHNAGSRGCVFLIDSLHCYDDFILQLDDAITHALSDQRSSVGFRCCRDLMSTGGRIFFHCNDHAFERIPQYRTMLGENRDAGDNYEEIDGRLALPDGLWNYKGLAAYRPWGPKPNWTPANSFVAPKFDDGCLSFEAAQWRPNAELDVYLASSSFILPTGKFAIEWQTDRRS